MNKKLFLLLTIAPFLPLCAEEAPSTTNGTTETTKPTDENESTLNEELAQTKALLNLHRPSGNRPKPAPRPRPVQAKPVEAPTPSPVDAAITAKEDAPVPQANLIRPIAKPYTFTRPPRPVVEAKPIQVHQARQSEDDTMRAAIADRMRLVKSIYHGASMVKRLLSSLSKGKIEQLLKAVDEYGNTALHVAVTYNDLQATLLLLNHGSDPNAPNFEGKTPLHLACSDHVAAALLDNGARMQMADHDGKSPAQRVQERCKNYRTYYNKECPLLEKAAAYFAEIAHRMATNN